jgi:hypothetical protein
MHILFTLILLISSTLHAGIVEALQLRSEVELSHAKPYIFTNEDVRTIKLRTTRGFDQQESQNCWMFAALNMLETNYLEKNKGLDSKDIEISRWYMNSGDSNYNRRGVSVDAIYVYSLETGFVAFADESNRVLEETTFLSKKYTPLELRSKIIGEDKYTSYAFSSTLKGWNKHRDVDALHGTQSYYVKKDRFHEIVKKSLEAGKSLTYYYSGHIIQLYGAEYNADGVATKYFMKDSYPGYFYTADANAIALKAKEISTIANIIE